MNKFKTMGRQIDVYNSYKIVFVVLMLLHFNRFLFDHFLSVFVWGIGILGVVVLMFDFFGERRFLSASGSTELLLFLAFYVVTMLINYKYNFVGNIKVLLWLTVFTMVIFPISKNEERVKVENMFTLIVNITIFAAFILSLLSIIFMIFGIGFSSVNPITKVWTIVGLRGGRLWGVYWDPNFGAVFATCVIVLSVFRFNKDITVPMRMFLIFNILLQYLYITYSVSRAGAICLSIAMIMLTIGEAFSYFNGNKLKWKTVIIKLICGLLVTLALLMMQNIICAVTSEIFIESDGNLTNSSTSPGDKPTYEIDFERKGEKVDNARISIWKAALEIWNESKIFGTSFGGYIKFAQGYFEDNFIAKYGNSIHNEAIKVLMASGCVGIGMIALLAIRCIKQLVQWYKSKKNEYISCKMVWCLTTAITVIVSGGMFLDTIFYTYSWSAITFWLFLGMLMFLTDVEKKNNKLAIFVDNIFLKFNKRID